MTRHFIWVFPALVSGVCAAQAESGKPPALAPAIERCIRDNAAKVEAAVPDLKRAVDFLVDDVCAEPVARENARKQAISVKQSAAHFQKMCDEEKARASRGSTKNKNEGDVDACAMAGIASIGIANTNAYADSDDEEDNDDPSFVGTGPPAAIALASRLLLDLRLSDTSRERPR